MAVLHYHCLMNGKNNSSITNGDDARCECHARRPYVGFQMTYHQMVSTDVKWCLILWGWGYKTGGSRTKVNYIHKMLHSII